MMVNVPSCSHVSSPSLYMTRLYRSLPATSPLRLDITPFFFIYAALCSLPFLLPSSNQSLPILQVPISPPSNTTASAPSGPSILSLMDGCSSSSIIILVLFVIAVSLHVIACLACTWSVRVLCLTRFRRVHSSRSATHVVLQQTALSPWEIVPIQRISGIRGFTYQHRKFIWSIDINAFVELDFPTAHVRQHYVSAQGLGHDDDDMFIRRHKYGLNMFKIPMPLFSELFAEHATSPFFVFQMFCVSLWLLDEYWYYSLMTLFMLVAFEMSVVKRRISSLEQIRSMRAAVYDVSVYRTGRWRTVKTSELLPGDILSLKRYPPSSGHNVPCDVVLIKGSCVVDESLLTGESVPQLKEPLSASGMLSLPLDIEGSDKAHVLFGGTRVIVQSPPTESRRPPDGGAIAYVLRTGFHTAQGRLVSTMMSATDRVTVNNTESFMFIFCLLLFAIASASYVLYESWGDPSRARSKLILNCIMIITSVVPPELPMELSLAVNTSLAALLQKRIFCTEPFRIPLAGAVNTICFDKTGTLTEDEFEFLGVASQDTGSSSVSAPEKSGTVSKPDHLLLSSTVDPRSWASRVIGSCHSLVFLDGNIVGDPLEIAAVQAVSWQALSGSGAGILSLRNSVSHDSLKIVRRFAFESALRRMTCIVNLNESQSIVVCKGAPEALVSLLASVPDQYEATHKYYSRRGCRVLAMAYRPLRSVSINEPSALKLSRGEVESNLVFTGFMVLESPIKTSSLSTVNAFLSSSHHVLMITGDHALTACEVSRRLNLTSSRSATLILTDSSEDSNPNLRWLSVDGSGAPIPYLPAVRPSLTASLCVTGAALQCISDLQERSDLILMTTVFARVNPEQKQMIISSLKESGRVTLMCGDGTNDVGALKQSHVGVALLTNCGGEGGASQGSKARHEVKAGKGGGLRQKAAMSVSDDIQVVSLGDASVAAPFTAKRSQVDCCLDVVRQGRCTLVTTMQMYQILALQCLISAYSLSVLYLDGVKLGDTQMTVSGMAVAMMFLFISRATPLHALSAERPQSSVFTISMFLSIVGQFAIHLFSLVTAVRWAHIYRAPMDKNLDADFSPNVLNTVVYLISTSMTLSTFAANYKGHPFMQSLQENKALWRCLCLSSVSVFSLALEVFPSVNAALELHPMPDGPLKSNLAMLMVADFFIAILYEHSINSMTLRRSRKRVK
uniref:P-type ATPase A domain-containing protein n=1 Tax=Spongospora subterranea TaxID=70186 RepID=A0A0H5R8X7_9EUKA|eukprot:CRZ10575.1 hypothetical protein [Spongospora subterranea]